MNAMERHQEEWYAAVGRFSIAMGEIEWAGAQMLTFLRDLDEIVVWKNDFDSLIRTLKQEAQAQEGAFARGVEDCMPEADRLRRKRNSILHSGIRWLVGFEGIPDGSDVEVGPQFDLDQLIPRFQSFVHDRKDPDERMQLQDLQHHADSAKALSERMWRILVTEHWVRQQRLEAGASTAAG